VRERVVLRGEEKSSSIPREGEALSREGERRKNRFF